MFMPDGADIDADVYAAADSDELTLIERTNLVWHHIIMSKPSDALDTLKHSRACQSDFGHLA